MYFLIETCNIRLINRFCEIHQYNHIKYVDFVDQIVSVYLISVKKVLKEYELYKMCSREREIAFYFKIFVNARLISGKFNLLLISS